MRVSAGTNYLYSTVYTCAERKPTRAMKHAAEVSSSWSGWWMPLDLARWGWCEGRCHRCHRRTTYSPDRTMKNNKLRRSTHEVIRAESSQKHGCIVGAGTYAKLLTPSLDMLLQHTSKSALVYYRIIPGFSMVGRDRHRCAWCSAAVHHRLFDTIHYPNSIRCPRTRGPSRSRARARSTSYEEER